MRAWWIRTGADTMVLELREVPRPAPGPGQLALRIEAAALNRGEFIAGHGLHATGAAARPAGFEAAGTVTAVGPDVQGWQPGDRVMGRCDGAFAEHGLMEVGEAFAMPEALSWEQAACATVTYLTAHDMLMAQGRLRAGEWLLVTGIASGVGVAALQVARALGARVMGTSGSSAKLERLRALGLDVALHTRGPDFVPAAREASGGRGVDLVVNTVGGSVFGACVEALAFQGRLATVGYVDGVVAAPLDLMALHKKRLMLFGVSNKLRTVPQRVAAAQAFGRELLPLMAEGRLLPLVDSVFPFDGLEHARQAMLSGRHIGKIVLRMG
ncbi:NADPH:quinone reductase-like Zn-dependent oxidoreductase [Pseudacidovorax intermedius]|uniref:NADPH:quinone reductase-like Zn-dependent oxidoreductase n=2 Tax=Pseudacidovorax intermedius TaxID=433924 RepID=A0A370FCY6_9BURK|nr:NADPH:quinone reductase-like Zn-dependent oxidoreductase [Pseudacidovorax intermedius]